MSDGDGSDDKSERDLGHGGATLRAAIEHVRAGSLDGVVDRGHLKRRIDPGGYLRAYSPSGFDQSLLAVADRAVALRKPTAIVLPIAGTNIGVLLAASVLVAHFVRSRSLSAHVALVTKQLALRRVYDTLFCRDQRLADFFPRTVVSSSGISDVGSRPIQLMGQSGRLHFISDLRLVSSMPQSLDGIVVESLASEEGALRGLLERVGNHAPVLYLTMNPRDPVLDDFARTGAVWAWDGAMLAALDDGTENPDAICAAPGILRGASGTSYEIVAPEGTVEFDLQLARLWDDLSVLQNHPGGAALDTVGWAWGVFGALSQLAVPVGLYDRHAQGSWGTTLLGEASAKADAFASHAAKQEDREFWEVLSIDLEDAVTAGQRSNAKPDAAIMWARSCIEDGASGLAVLRNRAARHAFAEMLDSRPEVPMGWRDCIRVATFSEVLGGRVDYAQEMLYSGPITSRYGGLLALPVSRRLTILAHGPWEARRVDRQVRVETQLLTELAHGVRHAEAVDLLFAGADPGPRCTPTAVSVAGTPVQAPPAIAPSAREAVWDPFDIKVSRRLGRADIDSEGPAKDAPEGPRGRVEALRIEFEDGVGFFEPDCLVSRIEGDALAEVAAKGLKINDHVVLIEGGARRDLFDLIVERLEDLPELQATVMLVTEWHERARRSGFETRLSYDEILTRMGGTRITTVQTIRNWVLGLVHGPGDAEDIRRFGLAVDDEFLSERWQPVATALATMRVHRRKVGKMLARVMSGMTPEDLEDDGYFDRRLGIHYSDFADAVSGHRVFSVATTTSTVPYEFANRLIEEDAAGLLSGGS